MSIEARLRPATRGPRSPCALRVRAFGGLRLSLRGEDAKRTMRRFKRRREANYGGS
jgi:hypothetical protein